MSSDDARGRTIVFDGYCKLCSGWAAFLQGRRIIPPFHFVPSQSERGRALLTTHGIDPDDPSTFLVMDRGRVMMQSDAALHVIGAAGGLWRVVVCAKVLPKSFRDAVYRFIARNRYRWFGRRATCYLP